MRVTDFVTRVPETRTYVLAAIPFVLVAMYGWDDGAGPVYLALALLCACQYIYPTRLAWCLVFFCFAVASSVYAYWLVAELLNLPSSISGKLLADRSDLIAYIIWLAILFIVTWLLWGMAASRPKARRV